jgi:hypothetical protein
MVSKFIKGLDLSQMFFEEVVKKIIMNDFPNLKFDAALIGPGSEILGFDDIVSTDHHWGPRVQIFLSDDDYPKYKGELNLILREKLPYTFQGYSVNWNEPDPNDSNNQFLKEINSGLVNHRIEINSVNNYLYDNLAISNLDLTDIDWLLIPEQKLVEFTSGKIFYSGLRDLADARSKLNYYPFNVWIFKLISEWDHIAEEMAFIGRTGSIGDDLGSRIEASRMVRHIIRLALVLNRIYIPYPKWLTTKFNCLEFNHNLSKLLLKILNTNNWREREDLLCQAYLILLDKQNSLNVTPILHLTPQRFFSRDIRVIEVKKITKELKKILKPPLSEIKYPIGSIDNFIDDTHILSDSLFAKKLRLLYQSES